MMALTVVLIVAWAVLLRPQLLGGPAAYVIVSGTSMEPALAHGDLVVATKKDSYRVGDVVAYQVAKGEPGEGALVIHRVVGGTATAGYLTKGDNRQGRDLWRPRPSDVLGSVSVRLPRAGLLLALMRTPLGLAALAALTTFLFVSAGRRRNEAPLRGAPANVVRAAQASVGREWGEAVWTATDLLSTERLPSGERITRSAASVGSRRDWRSWRKLAGEWLLPEGAEPAHEGRSNASEHGTASQRPGLVVTYHP